MILRILLDQSVPARVCDFVRERKPSWEVRHVNDEGLRGATDDVIFRWAQIGGWIVITFDEDFADARMYPTGSHAGVVRLRVWPTTVENTQAALARLFDSVADEELRRRLVIVDRAKNSHQASGAPRIAEQGRRMATGFCCSSVLVQAVVVSGYFSLDHAKTFSKLAN